MQIVKDGPTYELEHMDMEGDGTTQVHFVEKEADENGNFQLVKDNVTNKE